ncbi:MAG: cytochrome c-type biogenesis protein CcmH [Methylomarinum sp.]|nr:cytochrome c-type biogenesis protein CcmH [Methylomarinum sp.]
MRFFKVLVLLILSFNCFSAVEYRKFNNPQQEQSYKVLIEELRCLVCQNQTIADSNADLAKDLRRQVYEMLQQGKSQDEIVEFMIQRYGDFVLYNPQFKLKTGLLWLGPVVFLLIGLLMLILFVRKNKVLVKPAVTDADQAKKAKVSELLRNGDQS